MSDERETFTVEVVTAAEVDSGDEILVNDLRRKVWSTGSGDYATTMRFDLGDGGYSFEAKRPVLRVVRQSSREAVEAERDEARERAGAIDAARAMWEGRCHDRERQLERLREALTNLRAFAMAGRAGMTMAAAREVVRRVWPDYMRENFTHVSPREDSEQ